MTTRVPPQMTGIAPGDSIQAAIDALPSAGGLIKLGPGTHTISTSLILRSGVVLEGEGCQSTTISYTGSAQAIKMATPASRSYGVGVRGIKVADAGAGTVGLDMESVSTGVFDDVLIDGFTTGVRLVGSNGFCVYNRFTNVNAQNSTTGWVIGAAGSNSNTFMACRADVATTGWNITDSNQSQLIGCQIENCTTGVSITSTASALSDRTTIMGCRFEGNTTNVNITSSNVRETFLVGNYYATGTSTDSGTRTQALDLFGTTGPAVHLHSALTAVATGSFRFSRSVSGGSSLPAMVVVDSNTGAGTPVTLQIETERSTGTFLRGQRGGTTYLEAYATGALGIADGITAPAAVVGQAILYVDAADGDLKVKFGDGVVKTIAIDT
jgi:hypothetical protein